MPEPNRSVLGWLALIAVVIGAGVAAFAYTAGWFSPRRLTPTRLVDALAPSAGPSLGHRRNHAKGICFTGEFEANGAGSELSKAQVFASGRYPVLGRFNLATPDANAPDATVRVRGLGIRIATPDGQEWRSAMIDAPVFLASTPQRFYELLVASGSKDPNAMKTYIAGHPEFLTFGGWAKSAPWTDSYAEDRFNSLNSFVFVDKAGAEHAVRWSLLPAAQPVSISPDDLAKRGPDYLEQEIAQRVARAPQRWAMVVTIANPGDPTADPTKAWPQDRRTSSRSARSSCKRSSASATAHAATSTSIPPSCRPASGRRTIRSSAARSAAYMKSYDLRTAEAKDYPRTAAGAAP